MILEGILQSQNGNDEMIARRKKKEDTEATQICQVVVCAHGREESKRKRKKKSVIGKCVERERKRNGPSKREAAIVLSNFCMQNDATLGPYYKYC